MKNWNINRIITNVSSKYGAQCGRSNIGSKLDAISNPNVHNKFYDKRVIIDNQGYDKGGVYWGLGSELRVEFSSDLSYIRFYRVN